MAGSSALTLTVNGSGFVATSVVQVNDAAEATTYVSGAQLTATIPGSQLVSGADLTVVVSNGSLTSGSGASINLEVDNPAPAINSVSPASEPTGTTSLNITVSGTGFVPTTVINVNGTARTTTFNSSTQVIVALNTADVSTAGSLSLTAVNSTPGGGTSAAATVAIVAPNPTPTISSLNPATELVGTESANVVVAGTGLISSTVIKVNGSARTTSFTNATQVRVTLAAADLSATGTLSLTAVNPAPGGGTSAAVALPVNNPPIGSIQLNPSTLTAGSTSPTTITVTGQTFVPSSLVKVNGNTRATTYVNVTTLTFVATVADQANSGSLAVSVTNPAPGGGTSPVANLTVGTGTPTPVVASVTPNSAIAGSPQTTIIVAGTGFASNASLTVNGQALAIVSQTPTSITTAIPPSYLAQAANLQLVVTNPSPVAAQSTPYNFSVVAVPSISGLSPTSAVIGSHDLTLQVTGAGFLADSIVNWNGFPLATRPVESSYGVAALNATLPTTYLSLPTIGAITVSSPENAAAVSQPQAFPTYLALPTNNLVYNSKDGMLYASVPGYAGAGQGNSIVAINPNTGVIARTIPVGSEPDKLSISDTGTELFVSLDGAAAIKQIDLTETTPTLQFSLGEYDLGQPYSYPITAASVAALPGQPDSVAVIESNGNLNVFDSGVARQNFAVLGGYFNQAGGALSFGPSAGTLYASTLGSSLEQLSLNSTGFIGAKTFAAPYFAYTSFQYDAGSLYLNDGAVLNATTGAQIGQFYTTGTDLAAGPIVSDSALGRAWILPQNVLTPSDGNQILAFDETTFDQLGAIVVVGTSASGPSLGAVDLVRWGQNGLAFNAPNQVYILQSSVVKDLSQSPADLSVAIQAPPTASTGSSLTYSITVTNTGPGAAQDVSLSTSLADTIAYQSTTASVGNCTGTGQVICSLGSLASGATATVQVTGTVLNSGSVESTALVSSGTYDPVEPNNICTVTTTVNGTDFSAVPTMTSVSPTLILAGSGTTALTVNGTGFTTLSSVSWNGNRLPTTYLSDTQLTASVPSSYLSNLGWGKVTVSTPSPGGGQSSPLIVSIYQSLNVPAADLLYEPFTRKLYATVPAVATNIAANSLVQIDPLSGTASTPMVLGNDPNVMAEAADGNSLYIGFSGNNTLGQFNLMNQTMTGIYPLSVPGQGSQPASGLAVQPGSDTTLAIDFGYYGAGIFDISENTGAFRPNFGRGGGSISFADSTHLYSEGSDTSDQYLNRYTVDANGLTLVDSTGLNGLGGTGFSIALGQDGLVYGDNGGVVNPATTPPSLVALLPITPGAPGYGLSGDAVVPDSAQHKVFLVGVNSAGTFTAYLERLDTTNYTNEENYQLPIPNGSVEEGYQLLRWGQDGLAVRAYDPVEGSLAGYQLLLFKGPFVLPAEAQSNPVPGLVSVTPATVVHNSGNQFLTATGSGFIPGAVVLWNGVPCSTAYVDASHLQFAVSAADVASPQTISLTAENPGSSQSTSLALAVH